MSGKATESDILAWIEGVLPGDRAAAVEAAFEDDPSLRAWAASMRQDRQTMQAWAERAAASAPRGMAESAIERVEREALLGPSEAEALASIPIRETPTVTSRVRRYATAAAIVLLVGVIGVTGVQLGQNKAWLGRAVVTNTPADGGLAMNPGADPGDSLSEPHDDLLDAVNQAGRDANGSRAMRSGLAKAEGETAPAELAEEMADVGAIASSEALEADTIGSELAMNEAASGFSAPRIRPLSSNTAYAVLIQQLIGEVAIAGGPVISISPERASMADIRENVVVRAWSDDPDAVVRAMGERSRTAESPVVGWSRVNGNPGDASPVDGAVCTVSIPGEAVGFRWIIGALQESGASRVELTLRDGADPGPAGDRINDATGALWWGEPIRMWAGWVRTPILISPNQPISPDTVQQEQIQQDQAEPGGIPAGEDASTAPE